MTFIYAAFATLAIAIGGAGALPDPGAPSGTVTGLQILPAADRTEIVIAVDGRVETRDFTMQGPDRIVVDLLGARYGLSEASFGTIGRGGIQTLRASQFSEDVVRVVLELVLPAEYTLRAGDGYVRISMENLMGEFDAWGAAAPPPIPSTVASTSGMGASSGPAAAPASSTRPGRWTGLQSQEFSTRVTVTFVDAPWRDVLFTFAELSNRSIVPGAGVTGVVNADIRNQPWDIALLALLDSHGFAAQEQPSGIIRVDPISELSSREEQEPVRTRAFRINFANAQQLLASIESILSERGSASVSASTNSLVVTDIVRVQDAVEELIGGLDVQTPQITISAQIIFVNRTELQEFGVLYDLKDSRGNQLNTVNPGAVDRDGDGRIDEDEFVEIGTNVISLGGSSFAALGNANQRVVGPSLQFLTSLILGRHTLISFVEALQSVNLSDIQASPQITVLDNEQARILVGERTPIRVIDAGGAAGGGGAQAGQGGGAFPQATVDIQETGIVLEVTPHVTAGDLIHLQLRAERSGLEIAEADIGFIFSTQEAQTRVLVENGETVVIGGLTVTERTEVRAGIPLLKDLPLVGRLFRLTREQRVQRDLMILVTPQINRR